MTVKQLPPATSQSRASARRIQTALIFGLFISRIANAEFDLVTHLSTAYDENSNIFNVPDDRAVIAPDGTPTLDDSTVRYAGGLDINYNFGQQKAYIGAEARRVNYSTFTQFDHNEYSYSGGLNWKTARRFDGVLAVKQERIQESYADIGVTQLIDNTLRDANGQFNINIGSRWRTEFSYDTNDLKAPLPGQPDFGQKEWTATGRLKYTGRTGVSFGIADKYEESQVLGTIESANLRTTEVGIFANYAPTDRMTFNATAGKTKQHRIETGDDISSSVWTVAIQRKLTGKTSLNLDFFRTLNTIASAGSSQIDTGGTIALNWNATSKTEVLVSYTKQSSRFKLPFLANVINPEREDDDQFGQININYLALPWLSIRPFYRYQKRDSSDARLTYDAKIVGITLLATFD
jgi:hypothetical protein